MIVGSVEQGLRVASRPFWPRQGPGGFSTSQCTLSCSWEQGQLQKWFCTLAQISEVYAEFLWDPSRFGFWSHVHGQTFNTKVCAIPNHVLIINGMCHR